MTTDQSTQPEEAPVMRDASVPLPRSGTLSRLMKRVTTDESGAGGTIRRRRMKFTIDHEICEPGTFDQDFDIILTGPSSADELTALKRADNNPGAMIMELVKMCIVSVDGTPVKDSDLTRDAVWEALGTTGRTLVSRKWQELNEPSESARKKADASTALV